MFSDVFNKGDSRSLFRTNKKTVLNGGGQNHLCIVTYKYHLRIHHLKFSYAHYYHDEVFNSHFIHYSGHSSCQLRM
jgi:hypothetical protein